MWRITQDLISDNNSAVGYGRGTLPNSGCEKFRLYDDDGELYYVGKSYNLLTGFEPLDWAMNHAGCTRIDFYNEYKKIWETL